MRAPHQDVPHMPCVLGTFLTAMRQSLLVALSESPLLACSCLEESYLDMTLVTVEVEKYGGSLTEFCILVLIPLCKVHVKKLEVVKSG